MHQTRFRLRLYSRPRWKAHSAFSDLLGGPTSKGKKWKRKSKREETNRKEKERGRTKRERMWKGRGQGSPIDIFDYATDNNDKVELHEPSHGKCVEK